MARTEITSGESSTRGRAVRRGHEEGGKYARYTEEQIDILEKVYAECSNPSHVQRAKIMREEPALSGIDSKQLKVWFQNRRCRERQKKENGNLVSENKRLATSNKLLREENDGLLEKLNQLIRENEHLQNQVLSLTSPVTPANTDSMQNIFATYTGTSSTGANTASVQNNFASYPGVNSTGAIRASVPNTGGVMPPGSYPVMNSVESNPALVQNISGGLISLGSSPIININSTEVNPAFMQNISGEIMQSGSYLILSSNEANPASVEEIITGGVMPSGSYPETNSIEANPAGDFGSTQESTYAANLANLICQSYRATLGVDMLGFNSQQTAESIAEMIQHHPYAILCFSFTSLLVCLYANQAALNMLEMTVDNLPTLTVDRILDGTHTLSLFSILPTIMEQGYIILPPGQCLSVMNHYISYEQAVIWQMHTPDGSIHSLALAFINWSFI